MKKAELVGEVFGRLTVLQMDLSLAGRGCVYWECLCECGNKISVPTGRLKSGKTRSCKCLSKDTTGARFFKHGMTKTKEHRAWHDMKDRCLSLKNKKYPRYGGRGIKVCDRWLDSEHGFENFLADMGPCPGPGYSIERKDNDGDYCPENCVWATRLEQANNTRTNCFLEFNGKTQTIAQWAREFGIKTSTLHARLKYRKWSIEKALTHKVRDNGRNYTTRGNGK